MKKMNIKGVIKVLILIVVIVIIIYSLDNLNYINVVLANETWLQQIVKIKRVRILFFSQKKIYEKRLRVIKKISRK